ncbi:hypothetical protein [Pseudoduganella chitinolytica]|uniref:Uncharacterized protein n=1 Tax=Pseudoduganella chitinolytica TaxID=34070 RepID=A0ABY8B7P2_9BURK|nr:hypothetical protein [Pseudoduganella chitinolytica]WEF31026.1 hypothetical protein PX653_16280 [Pseudoduganella chitinolytica]
MIPLLLAVAVSQAYGAPIRGTPGTPGTNGIGPGAAGTNGGAAPALVLSGDLTVPDPVDPRAFDLSGFGRIRIWRPPTQGLTMPGPALSDS